MTTFAEKSYLNRLSALPCVLCDRLGLAQASLTTIHHIRDGRGLAQRSPHWLGIPLCHECHQGVSGIHGDRSLWKLVNWSELDALSATIRMLNT